MDDPDVLNYQPHPQGKLLPAFQRIGGVPAIRGDIVVLGGLAFVCIGFTVLAIIIFW